MPKSAAKEKQAEAKAPTRKPKPTFNLNDPSLYFNRELSWLEFNRRVLEEAQDPSHPLLERVKFLAIFSNNLDEHYMIRISGLKRQVAAGVLDTPPDGMTASEQIAAFRERVIPMMHEQRRVLHEELLPQLAKHGIHVNRYADLTDAQQEALQRYFENEVFPVLTPLAVDPGRPFPHISNLSLNLAVVVRDSRGTRYFARVKVPKVFPRVLPINEVLASYGGEAIVPPGDHFVWLEEVIAANLDVLFPNLEVVEYSSFRVTRNTDVEIEEDEASDLLETIEEGVRQRRFGDAVRLSVDQSTSDRVRRLLTEHLQLDENDVYTVPFPLGLSDLFGLAALERPELRDPPFMPKRPAVLSTPGSDIFRTIRQQDILLHHPYDSFLPVVEFFEAAATDPNVLAIKTTLYRVGANSPVVVALMKARENDKQVAALVELKARFDEENNIGWARALEKAGVHVVYGLVGLKTHCKVTLVVRREPGGIMRYVHLGTGNYNATTARIYTDMGMFTCRKKLGSDASELFNRLTGYGQQMTYRRLLVAPEHMREQLTSMIRRETQHARNGAEARLIFKMNALVDAPMIRLLYEASMAGVQIDLLVRGICCLRPGMPGLSENIRVTSVVGRFLEHSRIYYFLNNGEPEIYLGSADLMPRNLNRRVETLFPVADLDIQRRLLDEIIAISMGDNVKARQLLPDGTYERVRPRDGREPLNSQDWFLTHN
ncbi:MAG: polyphosphate kinase 1 [Anaerolineae bacterium]|nr:polyphosphate kinase 1 [Anaerolineae bacterium]